MENNAAIESLFVNGFEVKHRKDEAIEEWWFVTEDRDEDQDADLITVLKEISKFPSNRAIFVRRLSWLPLNYPCIIDEGPAIPAEDLLVTTGMSAQVLMGYWIAPCSLIDCVSLFEIDSADFELYDKEPFSCLGSVEMFEGMIYQLDCHHNCGHTSS